jgi:hypothetical protein
MVAADDRSIESICGMERASKQSLIAEELRELRIDFFEGI